MLETRALTKVFPDPHGSLVARPVVDQVSLAIAPGEFFSLLGPSGCGKTTLLRMIAGFERPTQGEILHLGRPIDGLAPDQRPFNLVFQRYALFPHLSVGANLGFGPTLKRLPDAEIKSRTAEMLALVRLEGFESRKIQTLSGGQQQRVALARALINRPDVLLLDEPLSALDLKLRQEMRVELLEIQRRLKHTFIFVTHDQDEALGLSDRIAVMNLGKVEQVGTPREIYERPATPFVAKFIGSINCAEGRGDGGAVLLPDGGRVAAAPGFKLSGPVELMVRPERVRIRSQDGVEVELGGARAREAYALPPTPTVARAGSENRLVGILVESLYQGKSTDFIVQTSAGKWQASRPAGEDACRRLEPGQAVELSWDAEDSFVFARG